jgi:hypothetical protein
LDEIRKLGAMDVLVSDRAQAQVSKKVHDVLRTFGILNRQSEPHNKDQNYAECGWKDTKLLSNRALDTSGAPRSAWFLTLNYICMLLNHVARESLNWRTPTEWLLGYTPDITTFLVFLFWEGVYTPEKFGRFAGISAGVGHSMTFIMYVESGDLIHRSALRSARHGGPYRNITAEELAQWRPLIRRGITTSQRFARQSRKDSRTQLSEDLKHWWKWWKKKPP